MGLEFICFNLLPQMKRLGISKTNEIISLLAIATTGLINDHFNSLRGFPYMSLYVHARHQIVFPSKTQKQCFQIWLKFPLFKLQISSYDVQWGNFQLLPYLRGFTYVYGIFSNRSTGCLSRELGGVPLIITFYKRKSPILMQYFLKDFWIEHIFTEPKCIQQFPKIVPIP